MSHGGNDIFVVALDSGGSPLWDATFGDGADQQGLAITVLDAPNEVVVGGQMVGSVDFGGGTLTASGTDAFLVRLSLSNGGHVHSARFGDPSNQLVTQLVGLPDGSVIAGGPLSGGIDFGGGTFFSAGGGDFFLARMDATDGYVWARAYGGGSAETLGGIDSDGTVLVFGGSTDGAIDVGTGTLSSASGTPDTLVAHVRL